MKQYEQNITFELNEKLSFETGQEIEEMISISIDPDIVIQAYEKHIQIRGIILLAGEYHRRRENDERTHSTHRENVNRYIEKVVNLDDDVAGFSHRFPVEIAVAKERIENIEDVVVMVDSFDYELPSANTLSIIASLHIHGISPERKVKSEIDVTMVNENKTTKVTSKDLEIEQKESTYQKQNEENNQMKTTTVIESDQGKLNDKVQNETENTTSARERAKNPQPLNTEKQRSLKLIKNDSHIGSIDITERVDKVESQINDDLIQEINESSNTGDNKRSNKNQMEYKVTDSDLTQNVEHTSTDQQEKYDKDSTRNGRDENTEETTGSVQDENQEIETTKVSTHDEKHQSKATDSEHEMQIELSESVEDDETDVKDVTFLTELFEEEEETYSQVTIYIAQDDDSIESIAKRYEIPVLQLLKDNNLSADTIEAGQLITIRQRTLL